MTKLTYLVTRYPNCSNGDRYIATAYNYEIPALLATRDYATYTEARAELELMTMARGLKLQWFEGSFDCVGGALVPTTWELDQLAESLKQ